MSAVLRAAGVEFDVERFVARCTLPVCATYRRGDPVLPTARPRGRRYDRSGVHVLVSEAGFDKFPKQVADAIEFLREHGKHVRRLCKFPGVEGASRDSGIARRDVAVQSDRLPAELVR